MLKSERRNGRRAGVVVVRSMRSMIKLDLTRSSRASDEASNPRGFLMQDIRASSTITENRDHPVGALLYTVSCMHCMTTSLAQGGMGLGAMWGEQRALELLRAAGFARVEVRTLEDDIMNNY